MFCLHSYSFSSQKKSYSFVYKIQISSATICSCLPMFIHPNNICGYMKSRNLSVLKPHIAVNKVQEWGSKEMLSKLPLNKKHAMIRSRKKLYS